MIGAGFGVWRINHFRLWSQSGIARTLWPCFGVSSCSPPWSFAIELKSFGTTTVVSLLFGPSVCLSSFCQTDPCLNPFPFWNLSSTSPLVWSLFSLCLESFLSCRVSKLIPQPHNLTLYRRSHYLISYSVLFRLSCFWDSSLAAFCYLKELYNLF